MLPIQRLYFIGVGPQRTGTSWLDRHLRGHPDLCLPRDVKETMYFDRHYNKQLGWYDSHFRSCGTAQKLGEIGPTYFDVVEVPGRISALNPECRIIISLRDPAERAFSAYLHHLGRGRVKDGFFRAIDKKPQIVTAGKYAEHIPNWLETFEIDQITFTLLQDIADQPLSVLKALHQFLQVDFMPPRANPNDKQAPATLPRYRWLAAIGARVSSSLRSRRMHKVVELAKTLGLNRFVFSGGSAEMPKMTRTERSWLIEYYKEDIEFVEDLLHRVLGPWQDESLVPG